MSILKNAWRKTFPSQDDEARDRMEQMKKKHIELQKQRQYSEDELQEVLPWVSKSSKITSLSGNEQPYKQAQKQSKKSQDSRPGSNKN